MLHDDTLRQQGFCIELFESRHRTYTTSVIAQVAFGSSPYTSVRGHSCISLGARHCRGTPVHLVLLWHDCLV